MLVMNKTAVIRIILIILIAVTVTFIWSNSLADSDKSSEISGNIVEQVKPIVDPNNKIDNELFTTVVRKLAHFTEFSILGAEMMLLVCTFAKSSLSFSFSLISIGIAFPFAIADELIQLTSSGRSCEFRDMLIDLSGIILGTVIVIIIRAVALKISVKSKHRSAV